MAHGHGSDRNAHTRLKNKNLLTKRLHTSISFSFFVSSSIFTLHFVSNAQYISIYTLANCPHPLPLYPTQPPLLAIPSLPDSRMGSPGLVNTLGWSDARIWPTDWDLVHNPFWTSFTVSLLAFLCLFYLTCPIAAWVFPGSWDSTLPPFLPLAAFMKHLI